MSHSSRIIDGLKTATNYSFYVRAKNKCGNWSAVSAAVSHTTLADTTAPAVLSAITLQMLDGFFLLKWAKPTTLDLRSGGYKVYVYTANTAASAKLIREVGYTSDSTQIFIGEKTQDVAITITAGTTYYFWVTTLDASGNESAKVATTPTSGAVTASGTALDHGALGDLLADDHTQYQKESEKDAISGYAGLNASSRTVKGVDATDDLIVDLATKGLVLKDTQGTPHYWRITIDNAGALVITDVGTTKP